MKTRNLLLFLFLILFKIGFGIQPVSLSGIITNSQNGKTIDAIDIVVEETETGTISNYTGSYLLYLQKGTYDITFSGKGYQKKQITVKLNDDQELMVELSPKGKSTKNSKRILKKEKPDPDLLSAK